MPIVGVLNPGLLAIGLACIAIPILVHLLRRRHRPVQWGAMRFLQQAYRKRRRRLTLEQLLLLITRVALVGAIAIGVGSLLVGGGSGAPVSVVVLIDDSIHARRSTDRGAAFEHARDRALALLGTLDPSRGDRAALVTLGAPSQAPAIPETSAIGAVRRAIENLEPTDAQRDPEGAASHLATLPRDADAPARTLAIFTSASGWTREGTPRIADTIDRVVVDAIEPTEAPNTAIVAARSLTPLLTGEPGMAHAIRVELTRDDPSVARETAVRVLEHGTGAELGAARVRWKQGERTRAVAVAINPERGASGTLVMRARIGPDANPADNARLVGLASRGTLRVGIVDRSGRDDAARIRPSRWVRAALDASGSLMERVEIDARGVASRLDPRLDALFVLAPGAIDAEGWSRIADLRAAGATIVLTPGAGGSGAPFGARARAMMPWVDADAPLARIDAPDPESGLRLDAEAGDHPLIAGIRAELEALASPVRVRALVRIADAPASDVVLATRTGDPFVLSPRDARGAGRLIVFAAPFDERWTDLPTRPLFVALVHEILRRSIGASIGPETLVAGASDDARRLGVVQTDRGVRLINPDASASAAPRTETRTLSETIAGAAPNIPVRAHEGDDPIDARAGVDDAAPLGPAPFVAALALALAEFVLARRCSFAGSAAPTVAGAGVAS